MSTNRAEIEVLRRAGRQVDFALSLALNRTAARIQAVQVAEFHDVFEVRNTRFFGDPATPHRSAVRRTKAATKRDPVVELAIMPPGGLARADIIAQHEKPHVKRPRQKSLVVPDPSGVKRTTTGRIPASAKPKAQGFQTRGRGPKATVKVGARRTVLIQYHDGSGVILRRKGPRRRGRRRKGQGTRQGRDPNLMRMFVLTPDARVPRRIHFFENAERVFQREFPAEFDRAFTEALALRSAR